MRRLQLSRGVVLTLGLTIFSRAALADCDPNIGKKVFSSKCAICHVAEAGAADSTGPNLAGVVGRPAASRAGFGYSPGMKAIQITWSAESLDKFLSSPQGMVSGTFMAFTGLSRVQDRQAVICYLQSIPAGK